MVRLVRSFVKGILRSTAFDIKRRLPPGSLEVVKLLLATYASRSTDTTIIQIGACDGVTSDPIHDFIVNHEVRAYLLEPNPYSFVHLQKAYEEYENVTLLQLALASEDVKFSSIASNVKGTRIGWIIRSLHLIPAI